MNHCFKCGGTLTQVRSLSKWTERFRCDKCRRGFLLAQRGRCVFMSDTLPREDVPAPSFDREDDEDGDSFDFGFTVESFDFGF